MFYFISIVIVFLFILFKCSVSISYIRKEKYRPATALTYSGYPTSILKQGGLESFGQRLISSIGKTKIIFVGNEGNVIFFGFFEIF